MLKPIHNLYHKIHSIVVIVIEIPTGKQIAIKKILKCLFCSSIKRTSINCGVYKGVDASAEPCEFCLTNMGFTVYHLLLSCHNRIEVSKN